MIPDAVVLGVCTVLAALITAMSGITIAMLQRNHKQGEKLHSQGTEIRGLVNGELSRERRKNEVLTKQLRILKELGIIADSAFDDPADVNVERRQPDGMH